MKSNVLLNNIYDIQKRYKELLTLLLPKLKSDYAPVALDEVQLFWFRHSDKIQLYFKSWLSRENSYVFTSSAILGYKENEHFPFLLLGNRHIFDDPLGKYSEILIKMPNSKPTEVLYKQIGLTAEDNLKLLENISDEIFILPFRVLSQSNHYTHIRTFAEQAFLSLFNEINSLDDYFTKCKSIDDIVHFMREKYGDVLIFSEGDDIITPFETRFRAAIVDNEAIIDTKMSDSENFYLIVFGYMYQAIDVIVSCMEYNCIPYIRNSVSLHYIMLLLENMLKDEPTNALEFKMCVAYAVHRFFDKSKLIGISLEKFFQKNKKYNFNDKLFYALAEDDINENNFSVYRIARVVNKELESFYGLLSK